MSETILVAGATGVLGYPTVEALRARGYRVRSLSRRAGRAGRMRGIADEIVVRDLTHPYGLAQAVRGTGAVVSCLGAPTAFTPLPRRSFRAIDTAANTNLIDAARAEGVRRFVYVAVHTEASYAAAAYVQAHEAVVAHLRASGLSFGVVRPTGLFPIFAPFLRMARLGVASIPGAGSARTNPVHPNDVAAACVELLETGSNREVDIGGPDILTRVEIVRLAFETIDRTPRVLHMPPAALRVLAAALRPLHPRLGELLEFGTLVFTHDCVAPARGHRRLADYFAELSQAAVPEPPVR